MTRGRSQACARRATILLLWRRWGYLWWWRWRRVLLLLMVRRLCCVGARAPTYASSASTARSPRPNSHRIDAAPPTSGAKFEPATVSTSAVPTGRRRGLTAVTFTA